MTKSILQLENTNSVDFKKEIIDGVNDVIQRYAKEFQTPNKEQLLTREETAKLLSVSLVTLWSYTKKDLIPAYRIGTKIRYKMEDVLSALQKQNMHTKIQ